MKKPTKTKTKKQAKKSKKIILPIITFNPEDHSYTLDGYPVLSVTQILERAGLTNYKKIPPAILEASRRFGVAGHKATELWDKQDLDESSLSEPLRPYLECWKSFLKFTDAQVLKIESRVGSRLNQYAGTFDRVLYFPRNISRYNIDMRIGYYIAELKFTASIEPYVPIQLAGYQIAYNEPKGTVDQINQSICIRLTDKEPELAIYRDESDIRLFYACLAISGYKQRNNIK